MSLLITMFTFSLVMSISPGPVNMIILSSGANYGIRKTLAFVSGATIGFTLLLLFIGLGFYKIINVYPEFLNYLAIAGSLFIIYMGYKIYASKPALEVNKQKLPTFIQGTLLQWLNPKAWLACVAGVSLFSVPNNHNQYLIFSVIYFFVCYLSLLCWSILGNKATLILNSESRLVFFNKSMGLLLIATACFLLYSQFR